MLISINVCNVSISTTTSTCTYQSVESFITVGLSRAHLSQNHLLYLPLLYNKGLLTWYLMGDIMVTTFLSSQEFCIHQPFPLTREAGITSL